MSKANFANFPPPGHSLTHENKAPAPVLAPGQLVRDLGGFAFGHVIETSDRGVTVHWSTGTESVEAEQEIAATSLDEYREALYNYAQTECLMSEEEVSVLESTIFALAAQQTPVNELPLTPLYLLEAELLKIADEKQNAFEHIWNTPAEPEAATATESSDDDIFAALGLTAQATEQDAAEEPNQLWKKHLTVAPGVDHPGTWSILFDGEEIEHQYQSYEDAEYNCRWGDDAVLEYLAERERAAAEAQAQEPQKELSVPPANVCPICQQVKVNKTSPRLNGVPVCKKCSLKEESIDKLKESDFAEPAATNHPPTTYFLAFENERIWGVDKTREGLENLLNSFSVLYDVSKVSIVPCTRSLYHAVRSVGDNVSWTIVDGLAQTVDAEKPAPPQESQPQAEKSLPAPPPERTEAGLVDPETGEVIEASFILQKFGWTELPVLKADATREQVAAFEEKLDQVLDRMCGHLEKAARYRAACEKRCAPYDGAAKFYDEQFVQPMARMLAVHKLKRNKKGDFAEKTLVLDSGLVKFTQGGGASIFDRNAIVKHLKERGLEHFKAINARDGVDFDSRKLLSLINKGELKDIPGTKLLPKDPLAKCKVVLPGAVEKEEDSDDE